MGVQRCRIPAGNLTRTGLGRATEMSDIVVQGCRNQRHRLDIGLVMPGVRLLQTSA